MKLVWNVYERFKGLLVGGVRSGLWENCGIKLPNHVMKVLERVIGVSIRKNVNIDGMQFRLSP